MTNEEALRRAMEAIAVKPTKEAAKEYLSMEEKIRRVHAALGGKQ